MIKGESGGTTVAEGSEEQKDAAVAMPARDRIGQGTKGRWLAAGSALLALFLMGSAFWLGRDDGTIAQGATVAGVDVGRLTEERAAELVAARAHEILKQRVFVLNGEAASIALTWEELGLQLVSREALAKAYAVGRQGSILERVETKLHLGKVPEFDLTPVWDEAKLRAVLQAKLAAWEKPARDASFVLTPDNHMEITREELGRAIDYDSLVAQILGLKIGEAVQVNVPLRETRPALTADILAEQAIVGLVAEYSTKFDPNLSGRTANIKLAAKALDGKLLKGGEVFSFNEAVGERRGELGYQEAMIIVNGEFVPGLGGGVCQVSSTLYNAVLLADLPIVARTNHALAITYVPLGQDATVACPEPDFQFRNDSGGYLLIRSRVEGNTLTFSLYGRPVAGKQVVISNRTLQEIPTPERRIVDRALGAGRQEIRQEGQPGYVIATMRTVKINGQTVREDNLGQSVYQPVPRVLAVGP